MTEHTTDALPGLPTVKSCPYLPADGYRPSRRPGGGAVTKVRLPDGREAWAVTGYAEGRALLADPRLTADRTHPGSPLPLPDVPGPRTRPMLLGAEGKEHQRQRRALISAFTVRRITALRPRLEQLANDRLDTLLAAGPPADLVSGFALPVPSLAICELLGVPYEDRAFFERQARLRHDPEHAPQAMAELSGYLDGLVRAKQSAPGDGLIDDLLAHQVKQGTIDRDEVVGLALVLLIAGHVTTSGMISLGTLALLEHPEQLAAVRSGTLALPGVVEELLRYVSSEGLLPRVAIEDVEVGGRLIREGDGVLIVTSVANRDETLLDRPLELDVHRPAGQHLTFGHGIHQCLGQNLARAELETAFRALFTRIPSLTLAVPAGELTTTRGSGLTSLPVTW
ncbi:cytochrome P450 [Nonomuraea spiralis]|uniref:Cytochrome P450 n=1 Tax=Nonomuraea spiralis TaxID=46182 RepID=A0ABV5I718_9ACTN|nr:cytochrome P450 [Nonomuraea spiralis]GGS67422.1 cytochrome P450 [Nonomuraea spiralis]